MTKEKLVIEEISIDGIHNAKVTKTTSSAQIVFKKKFRGRNVLVIIPEKVTCFSTFSKSELTLLISKVDDLKFPRQYDSTKKRQLKARIKDIIKYPDGFPEEYIIDVYDSFKDSKDKDIKLIIDKMKESYAL